MKVRTEGVSLLLDKLEGDLESASDVISHPDIQRWLDAYDWVPERQERFRGILKALPEKPRSDLNLWEEKIHFGLKKALGEPDRMRTAIREIKNYDWESAQEDALEYLPDDTYLDPVMIVTIDGFNGGMFRNGTVYLSLVYFDASAISPDTFSHELHHMGAEYWWSKDPLIEGLRSSVDPRKKHMVNLLTYLVGEGLANAFCSPQAITKVEGDKDHNELISEYEGAMDDLFDMLERLLDDILSGTQEEIARSYNGFTMDERGRGLPPGHFLSGRMVKIMDLSNEVSRYEIIGLVKEPLNFFELYNRAAKEQDVRQITPEILARVDDMLKDQT